MSEAGSRSGRSEGLSDTASAQEAKTILKRRHQNASSQEDDLLEQSKSYQEAVYTSMYTLAKGRGADSWRLAVVKLVLEALIPFLLVFNPTMGWPIRTSNPVWQVVRWALPHSPVARIWGYDTYIVIFYVIVATIYTVLAAIALLTLLMRKQDQSRWLKRFAHFIQKFTDIMFGMLYVAIFDYITFLANCHFGETGTPHYYWPEVQCLSGSHLIHLSVAGVTSIIFFLSTGLMLVASCDLNPVARGIMASPAAVLRLRALTLKAVYVIVANTLGPLGRIQAVLMLVSVVLICYYNFTGLPFLRFYINDVWTAGWAGVAFTAGVHCAWKFNKHYLDPGVGESYIDVVLYGVLPAVLVGGVLTSLWSRYRLRPASKFVDIPLNTKLKKVHAFGSPDDVEVIARAMRYFDSDGIILEDAALLGETVIKCGMATFPGDVGLLVMNANYLMEVRKDGPAARTQLQLALKAGPSMIQRYQIFSTIESSKRLKDGQEGQLDLQSYVEFKRNYRAVIRVHRAALAAQREFWQLMQKSSITTAGVARELRSQEEAADTAHQVYKRVLERYPANGKLLRCYGKFLEDVRNDPVAAARAYTEAARNGGGDGLLSLDLKINGADKPEFLTSMDLHEDACIVINAEGNIMMINACVTNLLGYLKAELEGANVNMIMPQPFSGRHASYLTRYAQGGEPRILDSVRDVVALHKERFVFPLQLCVTKLSGLGADAIFLGMLRPAPLDAHNIRAWVAPNGVILCTDPQFASLTGMTSEEMVGRNFQTLVTDMAACDSLLELCREATYEELVAGQTVRQLEIAHRYLAPVPVEIKITMGGTESQRLLVFNAHRVDDNKDGLIVVDTKGALTFATWDVAAMLGYPLKKFLKMKLDQLMASPFATMHAKHLREQSSAVVPTSCRAGRVVQLVNSKGSPVPVRLKISTQDDMVTGHVKHVVQVAKVDTSCAASLYADRRLVLLCAMDGRILSVDNPDSNVFGFTASAAVGTNLADCIDVFGEWRDKAGAHQMELLLLSLLDKEGEMPGTSWRVKVHSPETEDMLPNIDPKAPPRQVAGRIACLQSEIVEVSEDELGLSLAAAGGAAGQGGGFGDLAAVTTSRARIVLWRRDLLTGVVELDDKLIIRKADMDTGLIVGLPATTLARMPLSRLLEIPKGVPWDELMKDKKKKSALKGSAGVAVVSAPQAFVGPHPDCGTMRIIVQGVSGGAGSSRITATFHPDTTFVGARANVYRALGLEALMNQQQAAPDHSTHGAAGHGGEPVSTSRQQQHAVQPHATGADLHSGAHLHTITEERHGPSHSGDKGHGQGHDPTEHQQAEVAQGDKDDDSIGAGTRSGAGSGSVSDAGVEEGGEGGGTGHGVATTKAGRPSSAGGDDTGSGEHLHQRAKTQTDFIASWVRQVSRQVSRQPSGVPTAGAPSRGASGALPLEGGGGSGGGGRSGDLSVGFAGGQHGPSMRRGKAELQPFGTIAEGEEDEDGDNGEEDELGRRFSKMDSGMARGSAPGPGGVGGARGAEGGATAGADDGASSQGDDDDATSNGQGQAFSDSSSAVDVDINTDARRARVLKRMLKVFSGPTLAIPLERLYIRTFFILAIMLITHVVCYVVLQDMVVEQFKNVQELHRMALATDRVQVAVTKASLIDFCTRPGVAAVSVCEVHYNHSIDDLRSSLLDLESYHQSLYLGLNVKPEAPDDDNLLRLWGTPTQTYSVLMDTSPASWVNLTTSVWQLGNRFLAAGRELLYWSLELEGRISHMRAYQFMLANGPWSLFEGYTVSLEYMAAHSWDDITSLQKGVIVLLIVEAALIQLACITYEWWLVRKVELGRRGGMLVGLGLPGPILRVLANKPLVVLEDSDDEDGDEDEGDDGGGGGGGGGGHRHSVDNAAPPDHAAGGHHSGHNVRASMDMVPPAPGDMVARQPGGGNNAALRHMDSSASGDWDGADHQQVHLIHGGAGQAPEKAAAVGDLVAGGGGLLIGGKRGAAVRAEGRNAVCVNGKTLASSPHGMLRFLVPLGLWEVALIVVFVVSYLRLEGMQSPLASLNMASHVMYRYTRVRMTAFLFVTSETPESRVKWRDVLRLETENLEDEYDVLMYGGMARTQNNGIFDHPVPASTFESVSFAGNFFREERCFRWDQSKCYTPDSPYYEVTHHGIDVMMRRIISEMTLLVADDDTDAVYNGTRYTTMYMVGIKDMYEGLQSSAQLFVDFMISRYNSIKMMHTVLLVVTTFLVVMFAFMVLRPYRAAVEREAIRLAGLLSHVPAEMDVAAHTRQVLRAHGKLVDGGERLAQRAAAADDGAADASSHHGARPRLLGASPGRNTMVNGKV